MKKQVYLGISGGVDSAVSAALLKEQGYDVTGIFMKNWSGEDYGIEDQCPWEEDLAASIEVCEHLGIPHKTFNFEREYRELVVKEFIDGYRAGYTPNPDILCNQFIKFGLFFDRCIEDGADYIATGHYAATKDGQLHCPKDSKKDQTYFLANISSDQLKQTIFPLADLTKPEVRELAKEFKLPNADRKDSQGICFIGKIDMDKFLKSQIKEKPGKFIDIDSGKIAGDHPGVFYYTIGQRKGLKIGGLSEPYFVADKDIKEKAVYLAKGKQNPKLWSREIETSLPHKIDPTSKIEGDGLTAIIRYRGKHTPISVEEKEDRLILTFEQEQWAPAPGQSVVFYKKNHCLGSATIASSK